MILEQSKAVAAAANYTAGDVVSESATAGTSWEFSPIQLFEARRGVITHAVLTSSEDSVTARYRLHLFTSDPSASELDDNVAKNFAAADLGKYVGSIDFEAVVDQGAGGWTKSSPYVGFQLDEASQALYGVLEDLDGETAETAGMTYTIRLFVEDVR